MKLKQRYFQALLMIVFVTVVLKIMNFAHQLKTKNDQTRAGFPALSGTSGQTFTTTAWSFRARPDEGTSGLTFRTTDRTFRASPDKGTIGQTLRPTVRTLRPDKDTLCHPIRATARTLRPDEDTSIQAMVNISYSNPILQPSLDSTNIFLLIIVPSSSTQHKAFLQRQAIRETWGGKNENSSLHGNMLNGYEWKVVFLLGRTPLGNSTNKILLESMRHNDILQGDFNDGYFSVTQKIFMAFNWALLRTDFQFVLKADQDVYVHIPRLLKWLQRGYFPAQLYGGVIRREWGVLRLARHSHPLSRRIYSRDIFPPFAQGAFVLISRTVVEGMLKASKVCTPIRYDDPYLGILAKKLKVDAFDIPEFHFSWKVHSSIGFEVLKRYTDCQFIDILTVGDNIKNHIQYYIHRRIRAVDAMSLNKTTCGRSV